MRLLFISFLITFGTEINNWNNGKRWHGWNKIVAGRGLEKFCKIDNVVTMLNDMKDFCCLDLKCSVLFYIEFLSNVNLYATLLMA